jgi:peptide/nickel transport system substrate-binding protein
MARNYEPVSLNPLQDTGNGSIYVWAQIYEGLVEQQPGISDANPAPALATSWEIAPDGLSYTFHLGQHKFSNGDPVTAEDVKFTFSQLMDPVLGVDWNFEWNRVKDVTIVDPSTIRIDMKSQDGQFLAALTEPAAGILPMKYVQQVGQDGFAAKPIGSGPFMVKDWIKGQQLDLVRNPYYWRTGQPYLDGVTFLYIPDATARLLKVESGEAQIGEYTPVGQLSRLATVTGLSVYKQDNYAAWFVGINHKAKPLDEVAVRQALNYATPKDVINQVVFGGIGKVQNTMAARTTYWDPSIPPYPYDLTMAKQVLSQSSVPNGATLNMLVVTGEPTTQQTAVILQTEWAKIGIKVNIQNVDNATFNNKWTGGDYDLALFAPATLTSDIADDHELGSTFFESTGCCHDFFSNWNSPQADQLISQARGTLDPAQRQMYYSQLQKLAMDDAVFVTLLHVPFLTTVRDNVQGFQELPSGWWLLRTVWLSK